MENIFLVKSSIKKIDYRRKEIDFDNVGLENIPKHIKRLYDMLLEAIVVSNILVLEEDKDVIGIYIKNRELYNDIENEYDFHGLLESILKKDKKLVDLDFEIALKPEVDKIPPTVQKLIILTLSAIKLEIEDVRKKI